MSQNRPATYKDAGVNIDEADRSTAKIKRLAGDTFSSRVLTGIGSFGAAYALGGMGLMDPVLISSADGVGTKLNVAFAMGIYDTVGQDLVNHCVNDIAVQGARPLFFLDYFAVGRLQAEVAEEVVRGLSIACKENGVSLIGGETAEMPGMYRAGEFDLAGFIVGVAERKELARASRADAGDVLIGLPSTGLQTNGYSLARRLMFETGGYAPAQIVPALGISAGEELLKIHGSYLKPIRLLHEAGLMRGAALLLPAGSPLYLYGPYLQDDVETAPSNLAFDSDLRARNPEWGLRRLEAVVAEAEGQGFGLDRVVPMPANNLSVIFRKA